MVWTVAVAAVVNRYFVTSIVGRSGQPMTSEKTNSGRTMMTKAISHRFHVIEIRKDAKDMRFFNAPDLSLSILRHPSTLITTLLFLLILLLLGSKIDARLLEPSTSKEKQLPSVPNYCNDTQLMIQAGLIRAPIGQFLGFPCSNEFFHCRWQGDGFRTYKKTCRNGLVYDVLGTQNCNYDFNVKGCALSPLSWRAKCKPTDFTCPLSEDCVPLEKRCDGSYDCSLEEDEQNCPMCRSGEFPCVVSEQCVPMGSRCNGQRDCKDGTDELDCELCGVGRFLCRKSGTCLGGATRCDGIKQCPDGEDEVLCKHEPLRFFYTFFPSPPPSTTKKFLIPQLTTEQETIQEEQQISIPSTSVIDATETLITTSPSAAENATVESSPPTPLKNQQSEFTTETTTSYAGIALSTESSSSPIVFPSDTSSSSSSLINEISTSLEPIIDSTQQLTDYKIQETSFQPETPDSSGGGLSTETTQATQQELDYSSSSPQTSTFDDLNIEQALGFPTENNDNSIRIQETSEEPQKIHLSPIHEDGSNDTITNFQPATFSSRPLNPQQKCGFGRSVCNVTQAIVVDNNDDLLPKLNISSSLSKNLTIPEANSPGTTTTESSLELIAPYSHQIAFDPPPPLSQNTKCQWEFSQPPFPKLKLSSSKQSSNSDGFSEKATMMSTIPIALNTEFLTTEAATISDAIENNNSNLSVEATADIPPEQQSPDSFSPSSSPNPSTAQAFSPNCTSYGSESTTSSANDKNEEESKPDAPLQPQTDNANVSSSSDSNLKAFISSKSGTGSGMFGEGREKFVNSQGVDEGSAATHQLVDTINGATGERILESNTATGKSSALLSNEITTEDDGSQSEKTSNSLGQLVSTSSNDHEEEENGGDAEGEKAQTEEPLKVIIDEFTNSILIFTTATTMPSVEGGTTTLGSFFYTSTKMETNGESGQTHTESKLTTSPLLHISDVNESPTDAGYGAIQEVQETSEEPFVSTSTQENSPDTPLEEEQNNSSTSPGRAFYEQQMQAVQDANNSAEEWQILQKLSNKYGTTARDLLQKVESLLLLSEAEEATQQSLLADDAEEPLLVRRSLPEIRSQNEKDSSADDDSEKRGSINRNWESHRKRLLT